MRRVALGIIALTMPAVLHAQEPAPPTGAKANPITEAFRGFGYFGSWLVAAFDSIPVWPTHRSPTGPRRL